MEIQPADPKLRRRAIVTIVLTVTAGALAIAALQRWLGDVRHLYAADAAKLEALLSATFVWSVFALCIFCLAFGVQLWRLGGRVRTSRQFPPPGARVVRDTAVRRGDAAIRLGRMFQAFAVALALCLLGLVAASWRLRALLATAAD